MSSSPSWDPAQYLRFEEQRARPWHDLLGRLTDLDPKTVVDLGCGPGHLTATLVDRWPAARVTGVDSSATMIDEAEARARPGRLEFLQGTIEEWTPPEPVDLVISNAALQWVPTHLDLLGRWVKNALAPGGALAFQVPARRSTDAGEIMRGVATSPRWSDRLGAIAGGNAPSATGSPVREPVTYAHILARLGCDVDVWETTYLHLLPGEDPVLEWFAGTGLRPYLDVLKAEPVAEREFRAEVAAALRAAFPRREYGTILPFRRVFGIARL
jgi:trans-aconitate 2-methyltransferase